jgi:putative FmdB family regulatory protein
MPLYEYQCDACGARVEKIQKFSDPPLATCERCGGHLTKLLSSPAIQFKGSGWYITDYARKSEAPEARKATDGKAPAAPDASSAKSDSGKSDSTPAESKPAPTTPAAKE